MCDASQQLARARHLLDLMRGNGVYDIPQLARTLTQPECQHQTKERHVSNETWHADDCGGTCDGCGHIAADGFWYNAPCPDDLLKFQLEWAENGVPQSA